LPDPDHISRLRNRIAQGQTTFKLTKNRLKARLQHYETSSCLGDLWRVREQTIKNLIESFVSIFISAKSQILHPLVESYKQSTAANLNLLASDNFTLDDI